jgi:hypothetical protein
MTETPPEREKESGASPEMRRWIARREAVRAAAAADRAKRIEAGEPPDPPEGSNLRLVAAGLVVVLLLILAASYIVGRMRCDPFYSDTALSKASGCR